MKTLFAFFLLLVTCNSVMGTIPAIPADVHNHQLYYTAPATIWEETLPLGNGRLGMMPDGGVDREHIVLNEISLWSGKLIMVIRTLPEVSRLFSNFYLKERIKKLKN